MLLNSPRSRAPPPLPPAHRSSRYVKSWIRSCLNYMIRFSLFATQSIYGFRHARNQIATTKCDKVRYLTQVGTVVVESTWSFNSRQYSAADWHGAWLNMIVFSVSFQASPSNRNLPDTCTQARVRHNTAFGTLIGDPT